MTQAREKTTQRLVYSIHNQKVHSFFFLEFFFFFTVSFLNTFLWKKMQISQFVVEITAHVEYGMFHEAG